MTTIDKSKKNLQFIAYGEFFWLARYREGKTQAQTAKKKKMSLKAYQKLEYYLIPKSPLHSKFKNGEMCALARRRHGMPLRDTATLLGLSHVTLLKMERENDPKLVVKWKRLGFKF